MSKFECYEYEEQPRKLLDMSQWGFPHVRLNTSETMACNLRLIGEWLGNYILKELYFRVDKDGTLSVVFPDHVTLFSVPISSLLPSEDDGDESNYVEFSDLIENEHDDKERLVLP